MFETVITLLLEGEFVCVVRYPEAFRYLEVPEQRMDVEGFLARLGRKLVATAHGSAFYAAYTRIDSTEREKIRVEFGKMKNQLRFLVGFFSHVMQALQDDSLLAPGSAVELNRLAAAIDANPSLRSELQSLANMTRSVTNDGTLRALLEKQVKLMVEHGYLALANAEREIFQVTGKIEYLQEVIDFVMAHESIPDEVREEEVPQTLGLPL